MAINYGFFNSSNNDRLYNAETFNTYFEGLIAANGVFENVNDGCVVRANTGLTLNVLPGKAIVNNHWVKITATETITLDNAHNLLPRYDAICLRWSNSARNVTLVKVTGTPASTPTKPQPTRTATVHDIVLAYVYVGANASAVTTANITDTRANTSLCGYITGLVDQVDVTELYEQYEARFNALEASMQAWETQQRTAFESWFAALTEELNVNTYITEYKESATTTAGMTSYTIANANYSNGDIVDVLLNNIVLLEGVDYTKSNRVITFTNALKASNKITVRILKSRIGWN